MTFFEMMYFHGSIHENICTLTERMVLATVENKKKLTLALLSLIYCVGQIGWFSYNLCIAPDINYASQYAPMTFTCYFAAVGIIQIFMNHSYFKKSISFIKRYFWLQELASEEAKKEMAEKIGFIKLAVLSCVLATSIAALGYVPYDGIHYNNSLFPYIEVLGYLNIPEQLKLILVILIFPMLFPAAYFVIIYGVAVSFYVCSFMAQAIMLKWYIIHLTEGFEETSNGTHILDDKVKQEIIRSKLIKCVKQHLILCRYAELVRKYIRYTLIWHLVGAVLLITSCSYLMLFQSAAVFNRIPVLIEWNIVAFGTYMYCYMGEAFENQMDELFYSTRHSKWYYYNLSNRKILLNFLINIRRYKVDCGGMLFLNLQLFIWVFQRVYALLNVLSVMKK